MNKHYYGNGKPVNVFRNQVKLAGWHNQTLTGESVTFADGYEDTADVELTGNQDGLNDVSGNLLSNGVIVGALPPLRKVGTVADSHVMRTGVKTKRISDWVSLTGGLSWSNDQDRIGYKKFLIVFNTIGGVPVTRHPNKAFKYDTTPLMDADNGIDRIISWCFYSGGIANYIGVSDTDSGMGENIVPSSAEIKAYFYGWKMCNADGTAPYYKSEVPYTPSTWAEWSLYGVGSTKGSTGVHLVQADLSDGLVMSNLSIKPLTKYGLLYNVTACTLTALFCIADGDIVPNGTPDIPKIVGNNKCTFTTQSTSNNRIRFVANNANVNGQYIDFKDIRIFELPTGSQIEADFTNLTADQLAAKYTFNGLCVKNWKHVTDGLGQTAVLPTASYAGYTPYKMLYQLATPVTEQLTPVEVPTHRGQTIISTDSVVKPGITATAKVQDT